MGAAEVQPQPNGVNGESKAQRAAMFVAGFGFRAIQVQRTAIVYSKSLPLGSGLLDVAQRATFTKGALFRAPE